MNQSGIKFPIYIIAIAASLGGTFYSYTIFKKHIPGLKQPGWVEKACKADDSGSDCDVVLNSRWAVFPPKPEDHDSNLNSAQPENVPQNDPSTDSESAEANDDSESTVTKKSTSLIERIRQPSALYGLYYYTFIAVWLVCTGIPNKKGRHWHFPLLLLNGFGVVMSLYFFYIMKMQLKAWCPLCAMSHYINFGLLISNIILWPWGKSEETSSKSEPEKAPPQPTILQKPADRTVFVALVAAVIAVWGVHQRANFVANYVQSNINEHARQLAEKKLKDFLDKNVPLLVAQMNREPVADIDIRGDDPVRPKGPALPPLILFSDFQCPFCKHFADTFHEKFEPQFDGYLQVVFKHFPVNTDCNDGVQSNLHPQACEAAYAAEAARTLGGNDKFWEAHDKLFELQKQLPKLDYREFAAMLGLNPDDFISTMQSEQVKQRVNEDIELGKKIQLSGTPKAFLAKRPVPGEAMYLEAFWEKVGTFYKAMRDHRQQQIQQKMRPRDKTESP
jgi:protein-disulfide isomerase/uncharacterized membrane protein